MTGHLEADLRYVADGFSLVSSFSIEPGETVALVGPNGAGKSTIVRLLAGLLPLTDGRIALGDDVLDEPSIGRFVPAEQRGIGVVFQDHRLFDHLDVRANVAFGPRSRGVDRGSATRIAETLLDELDLVELADRRPDQLSGGQAQRVAIARALAIDPRVVLLDEPLAALDVETRVGVRRLLRDRLAAWERPALVISHDPTDALLLGDRVAVLEDGRLTQIGTPGEIRRRPATSYVAAFVGTNTVDGSASAGVVATAAGHELHIADGSIGGPVRCTIRPEAISLHTERPTGSQRNVWRTGVELLEPTGDTTRVTVGAPLALAIDVTTSSVERLGVAAGGSVWIAVKATEITVVPI